MIKVGFRFYHHNGSKIQEDGKRYFGYPEKYDEWLPVYSGRIAKHQTHTELL
jgi:hypothetical protein